MRRTISLMMVVMLVVQMLSLNISVSASEQAASVAKEQYVLNRLGIVDLEESDDTTAAITRATFASYVANALKLDTSGTERFFVDVPIQHWALGSIGALAKVGIINGTMGNGFEPDRAITYAEACKILVNAAGYGRYVEASGGTLAEYLKYANRIGISISPRNADELTYDEAIYMLYLTMSVPMAYEVGVTDEGVTYQVREDKTLFLVYHNVYIKEGRVETLLGMSLYNRDVNEKSEVIVSNEVCQLDSGYSIRDLFGRKVEYITIKGKSDAKGTLIYAEAVIPNEITEITSDTVTGFDTQRYAIEYTKGKSSNSTYATIERGALVILNGRILTGSLSEQIQLFADETRKGTIKLISTENNSRVDLVIIESRKIYTAGSYHTMDEVLYSHYNDAPVKFEDYEVVVIHTPEGMETAMPTTFPTSLGIAESDDGYLLDITVYSDQREVVIENLISNNRTVVANGERIKIDKTVYSNASSIVEPGQKYRIITDEFGEIIFIEGFTDVMQIGYLRRIADVGGAFSKDYIVDIYMKDMNFYEYHLAEKVIVDEETYDISDYVNLFAAFPGEKSVTNSGVVLERQVIRFSLNEDGKINRIDTYNLGLNEDPETTLERRADGSEELYHAKAPKKLGLADIYDNNTTVFIVPEIGIDGNMTFDGQNVADEAKNYSVGVSFFKEYASYKAETYYLGNSSPVAEAIICRMQPTASNEDVFMFDSLAQTYDEEEGAVDVINGWSKGTMVSYNLTQYSIDDAKALSVGDLYYVELDLSGKSVMKIVKMIDAEDKVFNPDSSTREIASNDGNGGLNKYWWTGNFAQPSQWRNAIRQLIKVYPYEISGTYSRGSYTMENVRREVIDDVMNLNNLPITIYDSENERNHVSKGSLADIKTYKYDLEDCSMIVIHSRYQDLKQVFVYR